MQNRKPLSAAFEKIANSKKVNLESQKVELGLIDEVVKKSKKASQEYEKSIKKTLQILSLLDSAILEAKNAVKISSEALRDGKELEKKADDIGMKLPSNVEKAIQESFDVATLGGKQHLKDLMKAKSAF